MADRFAASARRQATGLFEWTMPLRALHRRRRRFAAACFRCAGVALGALVFFLVARADRLLHLRPLAILAALATLGVVFVRLGRGARAEAARIEEEMAELELEATRQLDRVR